MFLALLLLPFIVFPLESLAHPEPSNADFRSGQRDKSAERRNEEFESFFESMIAVPSENQPSIPKSDSAEADEVSAPHETSAESDTEELSSPTDEDLPPTVPEMRTQIMSRSLGGNAMSNKNEQPRMSKKAVTVTSATTTTTTTTTVPTTSSTSTVATDAPPVEYAATNAPATESLSTPMAEPRPSSTECSTCLEPANIADEVLLDNTTSTEIELVTYPASDYFLVTVPPEEPSLDVDDDDDTPKRRVRPANKEATQGISSIQKAVVESVGVKSKGSRYKSSRSMTTTSEEKSVEQDAVSEEDYGPISSLRDIFMLK